MAYDKGTATTARKIAPGRYAMDSFRGEAKSYEIDLTAGTCTCPHFTQRLAGTGEDCKHLTACRAHRSAELERIAGTLTDDELNRVLPRYEAAGRLDIAVAIRVALHNREQAPRLAMGKVYGPTTEAEAFGR